MQMDRTRLSERGLEGNTETGLRKNNFPNDIKLIVRNALLLFIIILTIDRKSGK